MSKQDAGESFFENVHLYISVTDKYNPEGAYGVYTSETVHTLDNQSPSLLSVNGYAESDTLYCSFTEPVDPASALTRENYELSEELSVGTVIAGEQSNQVLLILEDGQEIPFEDLTLSISNISDIFLNRAENLQITFLPDNTNSPPEITISLPDTTGNNVAIPYSITDAENNPVTIHVSWSQDNETWNTATTSGDTLNITPENFTGVITWYSKQDAGNRLFRQGLCKGNSYR